MSRYPMAPLLLAILLLARGGDGAGDRREDADLYSHLGSDFELIDQHAQSFRLSTHSGVSLLFFGFTSCPDVCPLTMSRLALVMAQLPDHGVTVLFVSVDPRRDTPARLTEYGASYDFPWIGLTSEDPARIRAVAKSFAAGIGRDPDGAIDHSSRIYLLDAADQIRDVFSSDDDTEHMVEVIRATID